MFKLRHLLLLIAIALPISSATEMDGGFIVRQLADFEWDTSNTRIQTQVLFGNPSEPGLYIVRNRFPPGMSSTPHFHSQDRFVTVIEGVWYAGTDDSHDMEKTVPIPAGGFMIHPAGAVHYDGARDVPAVVEIRGMGPVTTTQVGGNN